VPPVANAMAGLAAAWSARAVEPLGAKLEKTARLLAKGRRRARRFLIVITSAVVGGTLLVCVAIDAIEGDWHGVRDVGPLALMLAAPAIVIAVRTWREP
jgi:hypothetical protein